MTQEKSLFKSTFIVSFMTATSRVSGFVREMILAHVFGASAGFDAFLVAFRIPNFMRRLSAEGAFTQAFVPILSEYRQQQGPAEVKTFLKHMAGIMVLALAAITTIAIILTPWLIWVFAPGYIHDPTRYELAKTMLRITFPYIFFISLTSYVSGILNSYGKFGVPAFGPNFLNFALIGAALLLTPYFSQPIVALAWGVFIGGAAQLFFQLPFLWNLWENLQTHRATIQLPRLKISLIQLWQYFKTCWQDHGVKKVLKLMTLAIFGVSVGQISLLIDMLLASFLRTGSLSWLSYAERLTSFPLGVFGVAIATVVLPHLSRKHSANSPTEFSQALDWGLKLVLIIALPAALAMMLLAGPILATIYQHGQFFALDVIMVRRALVAFAWGIPGFMLVKVLASSFYSQQNVGTPVRVAVIAMIANIALATFLIFPLAHAGLALASTLTFSLNAALLFKNLYVRKFYRPSHNWGLFLLRLGAANAVMGAFLWFATDQLETWLSWDWMTRAWHLATLGGMALTIYLVCLILSGIKLREFVTLNKS
jgi:putative peptidoglycan lipid II flippase